MQGIETEAVLDLDTDEWVLHTPSITATKYWPGGLGIQATHAIIFAKLIIGNKTYGIYSFLA